MPSLRQRMTTYLRQLSFVHEPSASPRLGVHKLQHSSRNAGDPSAGGDGSAENRSRSGCFVTQYLEGRLPAADSQHSTDPATRIQHGKEPAELPDLPLLCPAGAVTAACTGPDDGLCGVRRSRLHLSAGPEIDFIDTADEDDEEPTTSNKQETTTTSKPPPAQQPTNTICNSQPQSDTNANDAAAAPKKVTLNIVVNMIRTQPMAVAYANGPTAGVVATNNNATDADQSKPKTPAEIGACASAGGPPSSAFAAVPNWRLESDHAYGLSVSLYEKNFLTGERVGEPVADCYGMLVRGPAAVMAMADGVNWGDGARLAARSAIHGCLEYLDTALFGLGRGAAGTRDVFVSLLRSFWEAHSCILEVGGTHTTLTACVVLPVATATPSPSAGGGQRFAVCACNVGDSFGYVYSKRDGVREFTQGSHDIATMRDMRDALGALGPVQGNQPQLSNLTLSLTLVEPGDIVFLTSDGISDNFDPVVGRFAEAQQLPPMAHAAEPAAAGARQHRPPVQPQLAPKRQNRSTSAIPPPAQQNPANAAHPMRKSSFRSCKSGQPGTATRSRPPALVSQLSEPYDRSQHSTTTRTRPTSASTAAAILSPQHQRSATSKQASGANASTPAPPPPPLAQQSQQHHNRSRPSFLRSHTVIEPRAAARSVASATAIATAPRLPPVSGPQRHALTLLRLEDLLCYGINGTRHPCASARKLCHLLVDFARMITAARRGMLEQREMYYRRVATGDGGGGGVAEVELNKMQQRAARRRVVEGGTFGQLPGKLDHASVVAFTVERYDVVEAAAANAAGATGAKPKRAADPVETDF